MTELQRTGPSVIDVNELFDGQKFGRSAVVFLILATLAMVADGFDISAMGFVAPELVKQWHIAPAELVPAFSAGVFGLLFGAPLLGYFGDRLGRKKAILIGLGMFGGFTLIAAAAQTLNQFVVLRFLTGLGLGGMIPNIIALAAEVAPKRLRGMFVIIVNFGVPAGIALPGWVAAGLVPTYGWPVLLIVGGVLPLAVGLLSLVFMPESMRYLIQRGGREDLVRQHARRLRPDLAIDTGTRFVMPVPTPVAGRAGTIGKLFSGGLAFVTPAIWVALAANQFTNFFTLSWLPTLLQSSGMTTAQAGITASMFATGGLIGGLVLTFIIDRLGAIPVVILFLLGAPMVAAIGYPGVPAGAIGFVIACAGFCVTGNNFGINAVVGMIYPTAVRSSGAGLAGAAGRLGSLAAQIVGGLLLAQHLPLQETFLAPAFSLLVGAAAAGFLILLCVRRFGGYRVDDTAVARTMGAASPIPGIAVGAEKSVV